MYNDIPCGHVRSPNLQILSGMSLSVGKLVAFYAAESASLVVLEVLVPLVPFAMITRSECKLPNKVF